MLLLAFLHFLSKDYSSTTNKSNIVNAVEIIAKTNKTCPIKNNQKQL
jgi:hypothetical protein